MACGLLARSGSPGAAELSACTKLPCNTALSSQGQQCGTPGDGAWFSPVASSLIISSAVKINITEAPLKDAQCTLVSGSRKCTSVPHLSSRLGSSPVLFGALVELFPMSHRLAGCQLPVRRTGEGLDPVMDRRWKNCHRKTASGFSLDRGADANL